MTMKRRNLTISFGRLAAALSVALALASLAHAISPVEYRARIDLARVKVGDLLAYTADAETGERYPVAERNALIELRSALKEYVTIEYEGMSIETSNRAVFSRIEAFEHEADPTKRAIYLTEADELLAAISSNLAAGETPADALSKDEYKRKMAEILARAEYQKPAPKEGSGVTAMIERFFDWLRSLFPNAGPATSTPYDFSSLAKVLQIVLFAAILGLLGFVLYKFAPLLFPSARRASRVKKSHRTILGERIPAGESSADLFSEAERLARIGEIRAAIRKGYIALLCELSDKNVISLEQHKTNRDYLRDVRSRQALYGSVRGLTNSFERHWYGEKPSAAGDWESFRESYKKAVADA